MWVLLDAELADLEAALRSRAAAEIEEDWEIAADDLDEERAE